MSNDEEKKKQDQDRDVEIVQKVIDTLGEHFDSVQIFCTRHDPSVQNGTVRVHMGAGNWFARFGLVSLWLEMQKESERIKERKDEEEDDE